MQSGPLIAGMHVPQVHWSTTPRDCYAMIICLIDPLNFELDFVEQFDLVNIK